MKATSSGDIVNGVLRIHNRQLFNEAVRGLSNGIVTITVERDYRKRTSPMNRYYHGILLPIVTKGLRDLGNDVTQDDVHQFLKMKFNYIPIYNEVTGEVLGEMPGSTAKMTTTEMSAYWEAIQRWASEILVVYVPDPEPDLRKRI